MSGATTLTGGLLKGWAYDVPTTTGSRLCARINPQAGTGTTTCNLRVHFRKKIAPYNEFNQSITLTLIRI